MEILGSTENSRMSTMQYTEIRKINVNEHVEKKNELSYLSWAWAVDQLFTLDENATWEYQWFDGKPFLNLGNSFMVFCTVEAFGRKRTAQLPIMDYRNRAMSEFTSFDLNTTMQRCLAKAISLHGIGLYIYAGEDLPPDAGEVLAKQVVNANARPLAGAMESLDVDMQTLIQDIALEVGGQMIKNDVAGAAQTIEGAMLDAEQMKALWSLLDSKHRSALKRYKESQKETT